MNKLVLLIFMLFIVSKSNAQVTQEVLNNQSIISLTKSKLSSGLIIKKISQTNCKFDTKTEQIIALKEAGVSDEVVDAMISKASTPNAETSKTVTSNNDALSKIQAKLFESGIYYSSGEDCIKLDPTKTNETKVTNALGSALTYGLSPMKVKTVISGKEANTACVTNPIFYFYFDQSKTSLNATNNPYLGQQMQAVSPNDFKLIKLECSKDSRAALAASSSLFSRSTGLSANQIFDFKYKRLSPTVFEVTLKQPLPKGEYAFVYTGTLQMYFGNQFFDFGVR